jgi:lipopolysaccharide transport system ATP-binding protein
MTQPIIEIKKLGKKYAISHHKGGYVTLRDVFANIFKNPLRFGAKKLKAFAGMDTREEFWALRGVDLEVERGEIVGIIGPNGAGKSTLLKILSRITPPTEGEVILRGRVVSLLEVGTGFHPELTGRENIFLNSAILGMGRAEVRTKFDEIVAFAGVEKFLDTPVKFYSSGMYVRLGFSIAAHLEPDILIVDEVLAVGDAEFQKKCLGKMQEVTEKDGRTILFVSHNLAAIRNICKRTVLIEKGRVVASGETDEVIERYLASAKDKQRSSYEFPAQDTPASISSVDLLDSAGAQQSTLPVAEPFSIKINFDCKQDIADATLALLFYSPDGDLFLYSTQSDKDGKLRGYKAGTHTTTIKIPPFLFNAGSYTFDLMLCTPNVRVFGEQKGLGFEVTDTGNPRSAIFWGRHPGKTAFHLEYAPEQS